MLHFVCCDLAYCGKPVEDHPEPGATNADVDCIPCQYLAGRSRCLQCGTVLP